MLPSLEHSEEIATYSLVINVDLAQFLALATETEDLKGSQCLLSLALPVDHLIASLQHACKTHRVFRVIAKDGMTLAKAQDEEQFGISNMTLQFHFPLCFGLRLPLFVDVIVENRTGYQPSLYQSVVHVNRLC